MRFTLVLSFTLVLCGMPLWAADGVPALSAALVSKIAADPLAYIGQTGKLIGRFGGETGLDAQGVDHLIAVTRARARAYFLGRLLVADLDGDLAVTAAERDEATAAQGKKQAEALGALCRAADQNGDGTVAGPEVTAAANRAAQKELSDSAAAELREVVKFDRNGDRAVSESELLAGVAQVLATASQG